MTRFSSLSVSGWRQFGDVELDFHPNLTIITGANGTGKSTVLSLLSQHFGWPRAYLATPKRSDHGYDYITDVGEAYWGVSQNIHESVSVGKIFYNNGNFCLVSVPRAQNSPQYGVNLQGQQHVEGVYINPFRPVQQYQRVTDIPTEPMLPALAFQQWFQALLQRYGGGYVPQSPFYRMKQAIISMAMFGPGNEFSQPIPEILSAFEGFSNVLRKVLPESLGFKSISVRTPEIVFVTETGDWPIDEASGGISALIEMAWQIYLFSSGRSEFVVVIDEPENHLHPAMQRVLMTKLIAAFPEVQFIVATHSPFIVSSVKNSHVYVLRFSDPRRDAEVASSTDGVNSLRKLDNKSILADETRGRSVFSERLDLVSKAGTAGEVLRDVLGVPLAVPDWVADDVSNIVARYRPEAFTPETLKNLRDELEGLGMGDRFPDALAELTADQ